MFYCLIAGFKLGVELQYLEALLDTNDGTTNIKFTFKRGLWWNRYSL